MGFGGDLGLVFMVRRMNWWMARMGVGVLGVAFLLVSCGFIGLNSTMLGKTIVTMVKKGFGTVFLIVFYVLMMSSMIIIFVLFNLGGGGTQFG